MVFAWICSVGLVEDVGVTRSAFIQTIILNLTGDTATF